MHCYEGSSWRINHWKWKDQSSCWWCRWEPTTNWSWPQRCYLTELRNFIPYSKWRTYLWRSSELQIFKSRHQTDAGKMLLCYQRHYIETRSLQKHQIDIIVSEDVYQENLYYGQGNCHSILPYFIINNNPIIQIF